jgi:hypothetical protein
MVRMGGWSGVYDMCTVSCSDKAGSVISLASISIAHHPRPPSRAPLLDKEGKKSKIKSFPLVLFPLLRYA